MMRSLYSGVAGLKTHQTKMDVIGNNIANVNTVAFKSASVTFSEIMYQTTQGASGPSATNGTGGINAKQIGLGVTMGSTTNNISSPGATQTTGGAFDVKINGNSFFIVSNGTSNLFTRAGSFYVDAAGNLAMTSTGYNVMGWQVDKETGDIKKDTVSALRIMSAENMTSAPEATQKATASGVLDTNTKAVATDAGYAMNLTVFDALGYSYTAKFKVIDTEDASGNVQKGTYKVGLTDVLDSNGVSVLTDGITAGNLFGTAETASDKGTLIAGRALEIEGAEAYYQRINKDTSGGVTITVKDATGAEAKYKDDTGSEQNVTMQALYLSSDSKEIEGTVIFKGSDGHLYAPKETKDTNGKVTAVDFISLNNTTSDENVKLVTTWKAKYRDYFADNYSGVDSDIYIDGNSTITDATSYYSTLTLNGHSYKTQAGVTLVKDSNGNGLTLTKGTETVTIDDETKLATYLKNTDYFQPTSDEQITNDATHFSEITKDNIEKSKFDTIGLTGTSYYSTLKYNTDDGTFVSIGNAKTASLALSNIGGNFENVDIDFTQTTNYYNGGSSTLALDRGDLDGTTDAGKKLGAMIGVSINTSGMIFGSYDNGNTVLLGQIAVAEFANASGLEKVGENCYQTTLNSGEFDGIGVDITANGGSMTTGALEMSNVDLSNEFTDMITTQRGFQANSRIITTSDTLLEELINLKR